MPAGVNGFEIESRHGAEWDLQKLCGPDWVVGHRVETVRNGELVTVVLEPKPKVRSSQLDMVKTVAQNELTRLSSAHYL